MKFKDNPYHNPENCGLQILESINTNSFNYDIFAVWVKVDDNTLWWDTDSDCIIPFESGKHDLKEVNADTYYNFDLALKNHPNLRPKDYFMVLNAVKRHLKLMA